MSWVCWIVLEMTLLLLRSITRSNLVYRFVLNVFFMLVKAYILKGLVVAILLLPKKASSSACSCSFVCSFCNIRYPCFFCVVFFFCCCCLVSFLFLYILTVWRHGKENVVLLWHSLQSWICLSHPRYIPKGKLLQLTWFWRCIACGLCWRGGKSVSAWPLPGTVASVCGWDAFFSHVHLCQGVSRDTALYQLSVAC